MPTLVGEPLYEPERIAHHIRTGTFAAEVCY